MNSAHGTNWKLDGPVKTVERCLWDVSEVFKGVDTSRMLTVTTTTQIQLKEVGSRNAGTSAHQSKHAWVPKVDSQTCRTLVNPEWHSAAPLWARPMTSWLSLWCHDYIMGWCHQCSMWHHSTTLCHDIITDGACDLMWRIMARMYAKNTINTPKNTLHVTSSPAYLGTSLLPEPSTTLLLIL